jgi:hypothetical protein
MPTQTFDTTTTLPHTNCTENDFYQLVRLLKPVAGLVDGTSLKVDATTGIVSAGIYTPYFRKITKLFSDLAQPSLTYDIELFLLPPGGFIHALMLKHSAAFTGGTISAYTLSIGTGANLSKFMSAQSVFSAPSATNFHTVWGPFFNFYLPPVFVNTDNAIGGLTIGASYTQSQIQALQAACETLADDCRALRAAIALYSGGQIGIESPSSNTSIRLAASATGGNTNAATAGSVDVYTLYSVLQ